MGRDAVQLTLGDGELSRHLKVLKLGRLLRYEHVSEFQLALHAPLTLPPAARGD